MKLFERRHFAGIRPVVKTNASPLSRAKLRALATRGTWKRAASGRVARRGKLLQIRDLQLECSVLARSAAAVRSARRREEQSTGRSLMARLQATK